MRGRRSAVLSYLLLALTVVAGLAVRFAPLGLPWAVRKYGGSVTWAAMIYWLITLALPRLAYPRALTLAGVLATAVEFLKLWHAPALERFRSTLAGVLLLGRHFSLWDITAYWLAISGAAMLDARLRHDAPEQSG